LAFIDEQGQRRLARVEFFERDDGKLEAFLSYKSTVYDAPCIQVEDFEDVVFPPQIGQFTASGTRQPLWCSVG